MKKFFRINYCGIWLVILLISLSLIGANCENAIVNDTSIPDELIGDWLLTDQGGSIDVCPEEFINFQSTGVAQLTCPDSVTITRNFTISNNTLTYTQTSISFNFDFINNNNQLVLNGVNVSRNLLYQKIPTRIHQANSNKKTDSGNSSEIEKIAP